MTDEKQAIDTQANLAEAQEKGRYIRKIRSFVKREGRLTKGQEAALQRSWPLMGLTHEAGVVNFNECFGREADTIVEIGFGMGHSLVAMAAAAPEKNFIGIEVHRPGVGACLMAAEAQQLTNLRLYEHDAVEVFDDCFVDDSLAGVQVFFPDPWHKKRHHKRRLIQPEFVETLRKKLRIGGVLHLATDWQNYAEHMLEVMQAAEAAGQWQNLSPTNDYVPRPEERPLTKFERRGERLGHGVWDLKFARKA
ncbi:tRNA (guanosine(46)-N7)-methyltransferase TrmB [Pseudidiomarina salilacus]|uniref:tRNA (guanosine(46)-N7)-methyltransferase TrmB n=1 Tax=Pseudidiomarina salilacus TaxID=3384452 RepID=UPI00398479E6